MKWSGKGEATRWQPQGGKGEIVKEYSQYLETVRLQGTRDTEIGQKKLQTGRRVDACE
jgi:hypothetical protein